MQAQASPLRAHSPLRASGRVPRVKRPALGLLLVCAFALGWSSCSTVGTPARISQGLVIDNVTIVNTRDGKLQPGMAVVIDGGKLINIARAGSVATQGAAVLIDARDKFVVPGYLDMHAHPLESSDAAGALTLMLAHGITGFRQMSGSTELLEARRQGTLRLPAASPEVLAIPGTILTRANAGTPAAAVVEVDRQKAAGADFIKVIEVGPAVFFTVAEEAKKQGLPFVGHLLPTVNVVDASRAGMRSIEHLGPHISILLGCSTEEAALRQAIAQRPDKIPTSAPPPGQPGSAPRAVVNPIVFTDPADFSIYQRVIDTYSDAKCRELATTFVTDETWQTPTLIRIRTMEFGDDPRYLNDPNLRYISRPKRQLWEDVAKQFERQITPVQRQTLKELWVRQLKLVKLFAQTGVKMMAGSDSGSNAEWGIAGFGLHEEFDLLGEAGLSPLEVLQMTTLNGAEFLGRSATMGTVDAGKDANLVLLDADPTTSIQNLHKINAVIRAGTYYSRSALDNLEHQVLQP